MPENYIQPVTDRQQCYTCHKTVTGKKKLSKCSKCHAITYCGKECQLDDFARHKWNCIPVMVTEYQGKGRGVMAARDIKMGEIIFLDKPVMKVPINPLADLPDFIQSIKNQIKKMSTEAKLQYDKFAKQDEEDEVKKALAIIADNCKSDGEWNILFLNAALINHSCSPNSTWDMIEEEGKTWYEVRAIKDISKGEEVTVFYATCGCKEMNEKFTIKAFGCNTRERRAALKKHFRFDCKCCVCTGTIPDQEDIIKELLELHRRFDFNQSRKKRKDAANQVKLADKIVDLTLKLYIGNIEDKVNSLDLLFETALDAKDVVLFKKALDGLGKMAKDTGIRSVVKDCEYFNSLGLKDLNQLCEF